MYNYNSVSIITFYVFISFLWARKPLNFAPFDEFNIYIILL